MSRTSEPPALKALPSPLNADGVRRKVGIEVEFSGLDEDRVAQILCEVLGGTPRQEHRGRWEAQGTALGDFEVYLDSRPLNKLDDNMLTRQLRDAARSVVPVEIVSAPIDVEQIADLDRALLALAEAGATGTSSGVLLGFGVHFNPEAVSLTFGDIAPVLTSYALIEDHIRRVAGIDLSRRLLPWVDPYPRALIDKLASHRAPKHMHELIETYLELSPSRNHGLDMLPLFTMIDKARVAQAMDMEQIGKRPTYHWRLPDCRIDEGDWSLAREWNRWVLVEQVAADTSLLRRLRAAWRDHRASLTSLRHDWAGTVARMLREAGL
ncbi:amidoligase family protein [Salipiger sp. 1_MG-2023]|uniref:amidoligase family protein n=1 Tax=Salipiger sp. 1_MG-2023 TaxID=3062665 RepID=UPI0026E3807F|nr:amidoligase family protein [Salipiger sp. 1_MG-2023]MDO6586470.1 amidoligase family protein [Salipiger sp. 1_MG-2023]